MIGRDSLRWFEIEDRRTARPQRRSLKLRRQKSTAPIRRAALWMRNLRQHDEAREIAIFRAESVSEPRADRRIANKAIARVHLIKRAGMIHRIDLAPAIEAEVVGHF